MRITIELTDAGGRYTTIRPETTDDRRSGQAVAEEAPPQDGGPPPEALLIALGAQSGVRPGAPTERPGTNAGGPPTWLVDVVTGGGGRST
jgi:hypothetical protein